MAIALQRDNMSDLYIDLVNAVMRGEFVNGTKEQNNVTFILTNPEKSIAGSRELSLSYMLGELIWYLNARNDVDFIKTFGPYWEKISDDGITNNSAYGYVIHKKYGFDQYEQVKQQLLADPYSRRALININVPNAHSITTKDEPCTIALDFLIRDGKLNLTAIMRSSDIWLGIPYDVIYFTTLQRMLARDLGVKLGTYTHFSVSLHAYERDFPKLLEVLRKYGGLPTGTIQAPTLNTFWLNYFKQDLEDLIMKNRESDHFKKNLIKLAYDKRILTKEEPADEDQNHSLWTSASAEQSTL